MAKRKSTGKGGDGQRPQAGEAEEGAGSGFTRPPERIASPFKAALGPLKQQLVDAAKAQASAAKVKPAPAPVIPHKREKFKREDEAVALSLAMHGVRPLSEKKVGRVTSAPKVQSRTKSVAHFGRSAEEEARSRLDALVTEDVKFRIERDRDYVEGARIELSARTVRELGRRTRASDKLDLHGQTQREAKDSVSHFVRQSQRLGFEVVCIVHGKGVHSEGGMGVLRESVIDALTHSLAAPHVRAFVTAPDALGGSGALLVELIQR